MASTIKVSDWVLGVQDVLQDRNPRWRRWPEADVIRYTNYGRMALGTYLPQVSARTDISRLRARPLSAPFRRLPSGPLRSTGPMSGSRP